MSLSLSLNEIVQNADGSVVYFFSDESGLQFASKSDAETFVQIFQGDTAQNEILRKMLIAYSVLNNDASSIDAVSNIDDVDGVVVRLTP